jgi:aryl-alcohol dehydrogenase-like predicted oxidoreductase
VDYVRLGGTGLKVSRICLGMMSYGSKDERAWHLTETEAEPEESTSRIGSSGTASRRKSQFIPNVPG